ncbi:hypothetical protein BD626DRAFT_634427 [Schizophyllum amplum]|uniref:F-box domain-containing protein n=1 Tax=Schizophyllum amplum TaxID=97359 RepID=A0A550BZB0_9AGAR|nr:hypothetical protein BD626DRAFT_634427 [Auriculariopsis ampla]
MKTLNDLPNELLEQITRYNQHWDRLPSRLSVYGVLSRVNRRLRAFAILHLFRRIYMPLKTTGNLTYVLKPRPLLRLARLLEDSPQHKQYIKHLFIGRRDYPIFAWEDSDRATSAKLSKYTWELLDAERTPWDLQSFVSLTIGCGPSTLRLLSTCVNLRTLAMNWNTSDFPDVSHFPHLDTLRLVGRMIGFKEPVAQFRCCRSTKPCASLRTLALHGAINIPENLTEHLHELYPNLRVLTVIDTALAPEDLLRMVAKHRGLEEVNVDFPGLPKGCRLDNLMDIACGRERDWPFGLEVVDIRRYLRRQAWSRILVANFAFVRERRAATTSDSHMDEPYKITSLALCLMPNMNDDEEVDDLSALLDQPARFPYKDIRHLALSCMLGNISYRGCRLVDTFMLRLATHLSHWESLETFTFHRDLLEQKWVRARDRIPLLDYTDIPSGFAESYNEAPTLANCLIDFSDDDIRDCLAELSRMLGRDIQLEDEDIDIDGVWMDRHESTMERGVRRIAEKCPKLRAVHWFMDVRCSRISWQYKIHRANGGGKRSVTGRASKPGCLPGELFPWSPVVGQELCAAKRAWPRRYEH